jgi:hypothetical protein
VIALLLLITPQLIAQTCLQNEYNQVQKQKLNCTANDVRIAEVSNVRDPVTGAKITTCNAGSPFSFLADFKIVTTSSQARENIGLYIATNSQTTALTGACVDNIVSPGHHADGSACTPGGATIGCVGSDNYHETDPKPDNCGDTSSGDFSATFGAGAELVTLEIDNFQCQAPAGTNQVQLPNCTSWQIPGGTIQCVASTTTYAYPFNGPGGTPTAIPGSPSKCNCATIPLGVTVQTPGIDVGKACEVGGNTPSSPNPPTFSKVGTQLTGNPASCNLGPEGGQVTYTVDIQNTSNFGSVQVQQVCDSSYGQIYPTPTNPPTGTCNAGTQCADTTTPGTGCATSTTCTGSTIAQGGDYPCTFTVTQPEATTVTDTASALVKGGTSGTTAGGGSNSVTVVSGENPSTATVTKGLNSTTNVCATIRYSVDVKNTSGVDETVTLSALNDTAADFGSITSVHGNILGTTCGVASGSPGLGTLSGSTGGGTLSTTLSPGSEYQCLFDGQVCGVPDPSTGCITHSNAINATLAGDENEGVTITLVPNPTLNVKICEQTTTF